MPLLFAVTLFVSASLLFMVQPMVGKMILPLLGGSPAVWNACMVFFQALLLLGYLYAHHLSTKYEPKKQWMVHLGVLFLPVAAMVLSVVFGSRGTPIAIAESLAPSGDSSPFLAVMALMTVAIGIPFFVASTSAPLIQKWFNYTGHPSSRDPYFLYAASNAGSLISLLGYPLFIEPNFTVAGQAWLFAIGFVMLIVLLAACGQAASNPIGVPPVEEKQPRPKATAASELEAPPSTARILKWIALAFVPSSLMLAVTFKMTTDIASVPLLWVVPLALYLITFIIAFGRVPPWFRLVIGNLAPVMILLLLFIILGKGYMNSLTAAMELSLYIGTFFAVTLMCHYELALDRPKNVAYLTKYYLMMSVGGVLGGLFNALIAPLIFTTAIEHDITLVLACLLVPSLYDTSNSKRTESPELLAYKRKQAKILDIVLPILTGLLFLLFVGGLAKSEDYHEFIDKLVDRVSLFKNSKGTIFAVTLIAVPVMSCFFFVDRAHRFALAIAILLGIHLYRSRDEDVVYRERTFFGILKVEKDGNFTRLVHGTTLHGTQVNENWKLHRADITQAIGAFSVWDTLAIQGALTTWDPRQEPLTYYHRTGPVGAMFRELRTRKNGADAKTHVAMVGLGTGSASCYALPGQKLDFYEIDVGVKRLVAERDDFFTYVRDAERRGATLTFHMGDARLKLQENKDVRYSLLLVDAFSSDAIPVHLLTKQAVELYMNRITDDGLLALHISNKYIALEPVVAKIAEELNLAARVWNDGAESRPGKTASSWVVLAKDEKTLGSLGRPADEQIVTFGTANLELVELLRKFGPKYSAKKALTEHYNGDALDVDQFGRQFGPQAADLYRIVRRSELQTQDPMLDQLAEAVFGEMFHPLKANKNMPLWTDDYSDVLRVMMMKEVQWVRRQFGLPTLDDKETDE